MWPRDILPVLLLAGDVPSDPDYTSDYGIRMREWHLQLHTVPFVIVLSLLVVQPLISAPVWGQKMKFRQPDGTVFPVVVWGDEYYQVIESVDGYTLVRDVATGLYSYAMLSSDGTALFSSGISASKPLPATATLPRHLRIPLSSARTQAKAARDNRVVSRPRTPPFDGSVLGLCLIVDFSDQPATVPHDQVDDFMNLVGYNIQSNGSVRDYFYDVSSGALTYTNYVPQYHRSVHPKSYYETTTTILAADLITEALDALEAAGHDFSQYDADGDGYIDALSLLYAGDSVAGLWPHAWAMDWSADGVRTWGYMVCSMGGGPELGIVCHETGHMLLGYPDLYDYDYDSYTIGSYCLMGPAGSDSSDPLPPCPYLRARSGWAEIRTLSEPQSGLPLPSDGSVYYRFSHPTIPTEYYLVSNMLRGPRTQHYADEGLALWHIDELGNMQWQQMTPEEHYLVTLVQADGLWELEHARAPDNTDLFDAQSFGECGTCTIPNTNWWSGDLSGLWIHDISTTGPLMTFSFGDNGCLVTPLTIVEYFRPQGDISTIAPFTYDIVNESTSPTAMHAAFADNWAVCSPTDFTVDAHSTCTVTCSFTSAADALPPGFHVAMLTATNLNSGAAHNRRIHVTARPATTFQWDELSTQTQGHGFAARAVAQDVTGTTVPGYCSEASLMGFAGNCTVTTATPGTSLRPLYAQCLNARWQTIYRSEELGGAGTIRSLALDVTQMPEIDMKRWTVRMKQTSLDHYGSITPLRFDLTGWTTVFQGDLSVRKTGWCVFPLSPPFSHDGTQNIMIDFSFKNTSTGQNGRCRNDINSRQRTMYSENNIATDDPLTWGPTSGVTVMLSTRLLTLRAYRGDPISVSPPTVTFNGGIWDGTIQVNTAADSVWLRIQDALGGVGDTSPFTVPPGSGIPNWTSY
jgi:M6 family metalloprotease-like protein